MKLIQFIILACLLFLMLSSIVAAADYYYYNKLNIEQTTSNTVTITPTQADYFLNELKITLPSYPDEDYRQQIISTQTNPVASIKNDVATVVWANPTETEFSFETKTKLATSFNPIRITKKVPFPLQNVPNEVLPYLELTNKIDSNKDIRQLANNLAANQDDLFLLEFELAKWVNQNIKYNLSSLTSEANEPSSWVLQNKYGVCDEITNLFISLNRALGIPARFVSGIAYSDALTSGSKWGNHGWAEVYFPSYGWVSYDVTYGEFAYIDPTHISLVKATDGAQASVSFESTGLHYTSNQEPLSLNTTLLSTGKIRDPITDTSIHVLKPYTNIGSYNLVTALVRNTKNYYVVEQLHFAQVDKLHNMDNWNQEVVLAPRKQKKVFWTIQVDKNLDKKYKYTFPVSIKISNGDTIKSQFAASDSWDMFNKDYINLFRDETQEEQVNTIPLDCKINQIIVLNEKELINCSASEISLSELPLRGCLGNECHSITTTHQFLTFTLNTSSVGFHTAPILVKGKHQNMTFFNVYRVEDISNLQITNIHIPENSFVSKNLEINFTVEKKSLSPASNVRVKIKHPIFEQEWDFEKFAEDREFSFVIPGTVLVKGENNIEVLLTYYDARGDFHTEKTTLKTNAVAQSQKEEVNLFLTTFTSGLYSLLGKEDVLIKANQTKTNQPYVFAGIVLVILGIIAIIIFIQIISFIMRILKK